jgi:hypothetical protein
MRALITIRLLLVSGFSIDCFIEMLRFCVKI